MLLLPIRGLPGDGRRTVAAALKVRVAIGSAEPGVLVPTIRAGTLASHLRRRYLGARSSPRTLRGETPSPPAPLITRRSVGQTAGRALLVMVKSLRSPGALGVGVFAVSVEATAFMTPRRWASPKRVLGTSEVMASPTRAGGGRARRILLNERPIYRTWRGLPHGTEDGAVAAFLDIELRRGSDPRGECINVAAGVPHDEDGVGFISGGEQGTRAVQKRRPRAGNNYLTVTPGIELARAQGNRGN